jgi:hypothetical protein
MRTTLNFRKSASHQAKEAKPTAKGLFADQRSVLTARIAALLDENNQLRRELASARTEHDALQLALNALRRNQTEFGHGAR